MTAYPFITKVPTRKHTWQSEVRMTVLPTIVDGLQRREGTFTRVPVTVKSADGQRMPGADTRLGADLNQIHHSIPYACEDYQAVLAADQITCSISQRGNGKGCDGKLLLDYRRRA